VSVEAGNLAAFGLSHATIVPGAGMSVISGAGTGGDNERLASAFIARSVAQSR
jgi:hypothetical protein